MISLNLIIYVSIGTAAMMLPILFQGHWYGIKWWKCVLFGLSLTVTGTVGTYLLFFVENGWIGGTSFFGAVFLVPVLFALAARLLSLNYQWLTDLSAPAECMMLAVMKVQCLIYGCCGGKTFCLPNGMEFVFPSQIVELVNALVIAVVLIWMSQKEKHRGTLYPWYMVIYGASRFVLNLLRGGTTPFAFGLPAGNVWSLVAIISGILWLIIASRRKTKQEKC